jgi:ABC-type antimicrobial peptide transport system permease subunit
MSEVFFPINDLLRRKLQTSFVVLSLTLCVASTLFLLLFSDKVGVGVFQMAGSKMTVGFLLVFSRFILFTALLIFVVGAIFVSFMVFVMMSQRVRDIGLMKAVGCPNDLIFGYFMTELLIITFIGCFLGVILAIAADYASISLFNATGFQVSQTPTNLWLVLLVFIVFFALALIFGAKPILDATKIAPARAMSPLYHLGLSKEQGFRVVSRSGLTFKIALRSLSRHKSAAFRIVLCLSVVFILVTVAVAGGIIANQTTSSWVERAVGKDVILIANSEVISQYKLLESKFYETTVESSFNYTREEYWIPDSLVNGLNSTPGIAVIDSRLVLSASVKEVRSYVINPDTLATVPIGDDRRGESLIIGIEPGKALGKWFLDGRFLQQDQAFEAVVGDTLAQTMFSMPLNQSIHAYNRDFQVVGVCVDPINNGNVSYVPLKALQNITGQAKTNLVLVKIDSSANREDVLNNIRSIVGDYSGFGVIDLSEVLDKDLGFLGYLWSTIMLLPLFSLVAASLCLIGYVTLAVTEQRHEFGVLRALGAKPTAVLGIVSAQVFVVLFSSYVAGIAFGIMITLLILVPEPLVTSLALLEIAGWLLAALAVTFIFSLYPVLSFVRKRIIDVIAGA